MKFLAFCIMFIFPVISQTWASENAVPVMVGSSDGTDSCDFGNVHSLNPRGDGFLAVRSGPGEKYPMIDRLYNNNRVDICDKHGAWKGIVYGESGQDCEISHDRQPYNGPCKSGWVHKKWVSSYPVN